jgi:hypothetical protein
MSKGEGGREKGGGWLVHMKMKESASWAMRIFRLLGILELSGLLGLLGY